MVLSVLIFNATTPLSIGGVLRFSNELINGLADECEVISLFGNGKNNIIKSFVQLLKDFTRSARKADVLHFVTLSPYNVPFILLAKIYRKPILSTYHGIYTSELSLTHNPVPFISHLIADQITRICSTAIVSPTRYLCSRLGIKHKVVIISNPLLLSDGSYEPDDYKRQSSENILLITASNFNIPKKFEPLGVLLEAVSEVSNTLAFKLLIFGGGKYLDSFKNKMGEHDMIEYMGFRKDMGYFLKQAQAYIHISGLDNQPYSIIEAMMLGKVIICNDLAGLGETVDSGNNYVIPLDKNSIAMALRALVSEIKNDPESFDKKGRQNRSFAMSRYSSNVICSQYLDLYRRLTSEHKA